jgi:hypothetical protein
VTTTAKPWVTATQRNKHGCSIRERNKAVVDEYFKAGVQGHLTSFAAYLRLLFEMAMRIWSLLGGISSQIPTCQSALGSGCL